MSLGRPYWSESRSRIWMRALPACATLLALLAAGNALPNFPKTPSVHLAISAVSHHDQRPRFDDYGPQSSAAVAGFLPLPPTESSLPLISVPQLFSTIRTDGFHYNRPPPVS